jgi:hypothetical protein
MKIMTDDLFSVCRFDMPDAGFSDAVKRRLPPRRSLVPQMIMVTFMLAGALLCVYAVGLHTIADNLHTFTLSVSRVEIPPMPSVATYLVLLAFLLFSNVSMVRVSEV